MFKIGLDGRFYTHNYTGIGRYIYDLCNNLRNYDIELVLFINNDSPFLLDKNFEKYEKIIVKEKLFNPLGLFTLGKKIDDSDIDLFHATSFIIPFIKEKKYIVTIHDLIHLKTDDFSILHKLYYELLVKRALLNAEKIITISDNSKKDLEKWLKTRTVERIYLGVDEKFKLGIGLSDFFFKNQIEINNYILYVGNNRPNKNLRRLLEGYFLATLEHDYIPDLVLTCNPDEYLQAYINDHGLSGQVKFIPNVEDHDVILLYYYALFFIFPSVYEGFGLPVLEAMSCGCPVATSKISSLPEVGGDAVFYFDPFDIVSIKKAFIEMTENKNLRTNLINKGFEQVKKFDLNKTAKETYEIYKTILTSN